MLSAIGFIMGFVFLALIFVAMSYWTRRNLNFYLTMLKKESVSVPLWMAMLVTILTSGVAFALNVIGELLRLVLDKNPSA